MTDVVQRVEDTEDIETILDSLLREVVDRVITDIKVSKLKARVEINHRSTHG